MFRDNFFPQGVEPFFLNHSVVFDWFARRRPRKTKPSAKDLESAERRLEQPEGSAAEAVVSTLATLVAIFIERAVTRAA